MNIALWIIQGLLAALFLFAGGIKLFAYDRYKEMGAQQNPEQAFPISRGLAACIGVSEAAGGLGLVLPQLTGIAPMLTPTAAMGLAVIMVLATRFHMTRKEPASMTIGLFVLCVVVVVGRGLIWQSVV